LLKLIPINLPKRIKQLDKLRILAPTTLGARIHKFSREIIMPESQKIVPIKTGALQSTGKVHPTSKRGGSYFIRQVRLTYGGRAPKFGVYVNYAKKQHYEFPVKRRPGRYWHYLGNPIKKNRNKLKKALNAEMAKLTIERFTD
jgi:hypothetical protein